MPNRLQHITPIPKEWGSEIIWGQTDKYIIRTIEIAKNKSSPIFLHSKREKHFIVVGGDLYFSTGGCCDEEPLKTYKLPTGWSWYIEPKQLYQYRALQTAVRLIEVSTYEEDVDEFVFEESDVDYDLTRRLMGEEQIVKKKRGRPKGSKNKRGKKK